MYTSFFFLARCFLYLQGSTRGPLTLIVPFLFQKQKQSRGKGKGKKTRFAVSVRADACSAAASASASAGWRTGQDELTKELISYAHHLHGSNKEDSPFFLSRLEAIASRLKKKVNYYRHCSSLCTYTDSFVVSVGPISVPLIDALAARRSRRRYVTAPCSTGWTRRPAKARSSSSVLEAQRRRRVGVGGLDEDGPEDLHVLAGARLDVLVQDVDAPLCSIISPPHSQQTTYIYQNTSHGLHAIDRRSKQEH